MIKIRQSTFETNSSSTHTITIVSREEYKGWQAGEYLYDTWVDELIPARKLTEDEKQAAVSHYEENHTVWEKPFAELDEYGKAQVYGRWSAKLMDGVRHLLTEKQYDEWCADRGFETSFVNYTTKGGEEIVAFGYGGRDA